MDYFDIFRKVMVVQPPKDLQQKPSGQSNASSLPENPVKKASAGCPGCRSTMDTNTSPKNSLAYEREMNVVQANGKSVWSDPNRESVSGNPSSYQREHILFPKPGDEQAIPPWCISSMFPSLKPADFHSSCSVYPSWTSDSQNNTVRSLSQTHQNSNLMYETTRRDNLLVGKETHLVGDSIMQNGAHQPPLGSVSYADIVKVTPEYLNDVEPMEVDAEVDEIASYSKNSNVIHGDQLAKSSTPSVDRLAANSLSGSLSEPMIDVANEPTATPDGVPKRQLNGKKCITGKMWKTQNPKQFNNVITEKRPALPKITYYTRSQAKANQSNKDGNAGRRDDSTSKPAESLKVVTRPKLHNCTGHDDARRTKSRGTQTNVSEIDERAPPMFLLVGSKRKRKGSSKKQWKNELMNLQCNRLMKSETVTFRDIAIQCDISKQRNV